MMNISQSFYKSVQIIKQTLLLQGLRFLKLCFRLHTLNWFHAETSFDQSDVLRYIFRKKCLYITEPGLSGVNTLNVDVTVDN